MQIAAFKEFRIPRAALALGLAGAMLSTGCAQQFGGQAAPQAAPVAETVTMAPQPLPEAQNEARYAQPVEDTAVVQVYGYPIVNEFQSQSL